MLARWKKVILNLYFFLTQDQWEHLNGRDRDWEDLTSCTLRKCFEKQPYRKNQNTKDGEITIKNFDFDAYRLLVFTGFEQLKSKSNKTNNNNTNFNNIYLIRK